MFYQVSSGSLFNLKSSFAKKLLRVLFYLGCLVEVITLSFASMIMFTDIDYISVGSETSDRIYIRQLTIAFLFIIGGFWYFPSTGFLFYRASISFALSHLLAMTVSVSFPIMIWQRNRDSTVVGSVGDLLGLSSNGSYGLDGLFIFVTSVVVFATFLAFSGLLTLFNSFVGFASLCA